MSILLVRHGEAVPGTGSDRERFLTLRGRTETHSLGRRLVELGQGPTTIVSSPLVRAVQTAEILAHVLGFAGIVSTDSGLEPDGDPAQAVARMPTEGGMTLVVCHEPIVHRMAGVLTGSSSFPKFRTSGATLIEGSRVIARLEP